MPRLDERALRRDTFTDGPRIVLGDGQEWTFPRPVIRLFPARGEGGRVEMGARKSYGADFEDRWDELFDAEPIDRLRILIELAGDLLLQNYDLDNRALRRLLARQFDDDVSRAMWGEVESILAGTYAPKATADGSDSPSS